MMKRRDPRTEPWAPPEVTGGGVGSESLKLDELGDKCKNNQNSECIPSCVCRQFSPQSKEHSAPSAMELTARITIDSDWSAAQMENRLALLFHKHFNEKTGRRFSFTYLQVGAVLTSRCVNTVSEFRAWDF